jgi:hypothetical protein
VPAVLRAEGLTVAVNAGRDPRRAKAVRDVLADRLPRLARRARTAAARRVDSAPAQVMECAASDERS